MPIRLNLLAEAQAAEDARRRDPVKRAIWVSALIVVAILVWSSSLQLRAMLVHSEVCRLEGQIGSHTNEYRLVLDNQNKTADLQRKLAALRRLSAERLLNGTLLDALQQPTADDVQLLRLRLEQIYATIEGTKAHTNDNGVLIPAKPPITTEKTLLTLEGADSSASAGDGLNKYKDSLSASAFLKQVLAKTNGVNLKNLAPPTINPLTGKRSVGFTLECRYPDKTR
jgi:hypothetical protein